MSEAPQQVAITGSNFLLYKSGIDRGHSEALLDMAQQFKRAAFAYTQQLESMGALEDPGSESVETKVARTTLSELIKAAKSYEEQLRPLGLTKQKSAVDLLGKGCKYIEAEKAALHAALPKVEGAASAEG